MGKALPPEVRRSLFLVKERPLEASETDLKRCAMHFARAHRWLRYHPLPGQFAQHGGRRQPIRTLFEGEPGWLDGTFCRGPMAADDPYPGLPARPARFIVREFKNERDHTTDGQDQWIEALQAAGIDVMVWRPRHWATHVVPTLA